jgi:transposase
VAAVIYPDKVIRRVRWLLAQGKSQRAIASELNISRGLILAVNLDRRRLRAEVPPGRNLDGSERSPEYHAKTKNPYRTRVAKMYRSGMSLAEIAAEAGVSRERVRQWLIQDGVARRPRGS